MPSKKELLKDLNQNWIGGHIIVSYQPKVLNNTYVESSSEVYEVLQSIWDFTLINLQEQFIVLFFNRNQRLIGWRLLNTGTIHKVTVDIKLLVCMALHCMASSVVLAHNHPSGNLTPGISDRKMNRRIKEALALIDVNLMDHLIVSEDGYLSMVDEGAL